MFGAGYLLDMLRHSASQKSSIDQPDSKRQKNESKTETMSEKIDTTTVNANISTISEGESICVESISDHGMKSVREIDEKIIQNISCSMNQLAEPDIGRLSNEKTDQFDEGPAQKIDEDLNSRTDQRFDQYIDQATHSGNGLKVDEISCQRNDESDPTISRLINQTSDGEPFQQFDSAIDSTVDQLSKTDPMSCTSTAHISDEQIDPPFGPDIDDTLPIASDQTADQSDTGLIDRSESTAEASSSLSQSYPALDFTAPRLLLKESSAFSDTKSRFTNNFLKGCKWSPDGSCLLTNSEDRTLRVFTLPSAFYESKFFELSSDNETVGTSGSLQGGLKSDHTNSLSLLSSIVAGELVYDYCWYPLMNSAMLESCVYVHTSCDHPIHLCDAVSGQLCATYLPIDHLDEVTCAYSLTFSPDGSRLYAGFNKAIRIFDTYRPGRQISTKSTWRKRQGGQSSIISCIAVCPTMPSLFACGSYAKSVATYSESFDDGPLETMQAENMGGITHLIYHPNGNHLFSGGRMDSKIICWDMRVPGQIYAAYERDAGTNQRLYFDLDPSGKYLISGGSRGEIKIWDTSNSPNEAGFVEPTSNFRAHESAISGVSINPYLAVLATGSGQRLFPSRERPLGSRSADSGLESDEVPGLDNSVKLWYVGNSR